MIILIQSCIDPPTINMSTRQKLKHKGPAYKNFVSPTSRMKTFAAWPPGLKQPKKKMVEAGFFYSGRSDEVYCYYCGKGMKDWMENDDPWEQHAGWSEDCAHVSLHKTEKFIKDSFFKVRNYDPLDDLHQAQSEDIIERDIDTTKTCKVCMDGEVEVAYLPCAHAVTCKSCAPCFDKCVICRCPVKELIKLYFA